MLTLPRQALPVMRVVAALLFALCLLPGRPALAGPWARAAGDVFLSFTQSTQASIPSLAVGLPEPDGYGAFYGEVGLGHRLTFGAEAGQDAHTREAMVFLRRTLTAPDARLQLALDLGVGGRETPFTGPVGAARVGASVGYGLGPGILDALPFNFTGGWVGLDAVTVTDLDEGETRWKVEASFGLTMARGDHLILGLMAERWPEAPVAYAIRPSYVRHIFGGTSVQIGAILGLNEDTPSAGLSLGLWQEF